MVSPDARGKSRAARRSLLVDKPQHGRINCTDRFPPSAGSDAHPVHVVVPDKIEGGHPCQLPGDAFCLARSTTIKAGVMLSRHL
jgi:hypothetical protein